jgi:protein-L-isoaspartate(D-aspartate) O-methyltransferase
MTGTDFHSMGAEAGTPRRAMIDSQLRTSGVNEPWVLAAVARVAREDFVPADHRAAAYMDRAVPLGGGRFLAAPLFHGKTLAAAEPTPADKALVVTAGAGYLAELLRPLVGSLDVVDAADVGAGLAGGYSLIVVDGAAGELPEALTNALAEGGRIVTGLVQGNLTRLASGRKTAGTIAFASIGDMGIPAIAEFAAPKRWSF